MTKFHPTDPLLLGIGYKSCAVFGLESGQQTKVDPCQDLGDFVHCGTWNTHDTKSCVLGLSKDILEWDTRQERPQILVRDAHELSVRNLDFNPNKPFQFASCGDDCQVRIWDQRSTAQPLMSLSDHSHWVWNVLYNPSHDQLLLTSGSDCQVNLQSIVSVSSVPSLSTDPDSDDESPTSKTTDGLVSSYQQHEESVYGISWSSADPWIFASLSYDGRLLVNFVPQEHKYKIIL
ncbi:WD40-repeat-containing domain protein [Gorgonomyces haynaldii]|nr:WD40-repeat-containing domain protein [Gorgonomyces haynaldii]